MRPLEVVDLARMRYSDAFLIQERLVERRKQGQGSECGYGFHDRFLRGCLPYLSTLKAARRFCCQQLSFSSVQNCFSLP